MVPPIYVWSADDCKVILYVNSSQKYKMAASSFVSRGESSYGGRAGRESPSRDYGRHSYRERSTSRERV